MKVNRHLDGSASSMRKFWDSDKVIIARIITLTSAFLGLVYFLYNTISDFHIFESIRELGLATEEIYLYIGIIVGVIIGVLIYRQYLWSIRKAIRQKFTKALLFRIGALSLLYMYAYNKPKLWWVVAAYYSYVAILVFLVNRG